jgi:hypothetical protein
MLSCWTINMAIISPRDSFTKLVGFWVELSVGWDVTWVHVWRDFVDVWCVWITGNCAFLYLKDGCLFSWCVSAVVVGSYSVQSSWVVYTGATSKVCWVLSSTVHAFFGVVGQFLAILCCVLLITFNAFRGSAAEIWRVSESLAVKSLGDGSWILIFFPFTYTMAQFMELKNFSCISSWLESYHKNWEPGYHCSSCFGHFCELRYAQLLDVMGCQFFSYVPFWEIWGMPFNTNRVCVFSGSGYLW